MCISVASLLTYMQIVTRPRDAGAVEAMGEKWATEKQRHERRSVEVGQQGQTPREVGARKGLEAERNLRQPALLPSH